MPLAVVSGRLSRFEPTKRAGSTSCASGLYDGNSLTSTEHAFGSGAVYARMACVDVTPLTCKLPTAPYATDAVRTIVDILIFSILNSLGTRGYCSLRLGPAVPVRRGAGTPACCAGTHADARLRPYIVTAA